MELAKLFAERGLGLQEMLLRELNNTKKLEQGVKYEKASEIQIQSSEPESISLSSEPDAGLHSMPVHGVISSHFGMRRHPVYGDDRFHTGVDIAAPVGTEVHPIRKGKVVFSGEQSGYGNVVIIEHSDGLISKYAHNKTNLVKKRTGRYKYDHRSCWTYGNSTGPHLHLEIRNRKDLLIL
jgi:murein DD-endopeptidase MepM/ murein hydrolase activator NlpD